MIKAVKHSRTIFSCKYLVLHYFGEFIAVSKKQDISRDMTKPPKWLCAQRRLRSAWASAQSDQSLRCAPHWVAKDPSFFMRTEKTLIRLGGCPGRSESSLCAQSFCWFCHVAAHMVHEIADSGSSVERLITFHVSTWTWQVNIFDRGLCQNVIL